MAYVITSACINETTFDPECERVCEADAIHRGRYTRLIDSDACTDCGLCDPVCPVGAIFPHTRVPESEREWIELNRQWWQHASS